MFRCLGWTTILPEKYVASVRFDYGFVTWTIFPFDVKGCSPLHRDPCMPMMTLFNTLVLYAVTFLTSLRNHTTIYGLKVLSTASVSSFF